MLSVFRSILSTFCIKPDTSAQTDTSISFSNFSDEGTELSQQIQDPYQITHGNFMKELAQYRDCDFTKYEYYDKEEIAKMIYGKYVKTMLMEQYNKYFLEESEEIFLNFATKDEDFVKFFEIEFTRRNRIHDSNKNFEANRIFGHYHVGTHLHMDDLQSEDKFNSIDIKMSFS